MDQLLQCLADPSGFFQFAHSGVGELEVTNCDFQSGLLGLGGKRRVKPA